MTILLLMAGESKHYESAGYLYPKNLVEVAGKAMIEVVIESFREILTSQHRLVALIGSEENQCYHTDAVVKLLVPEAKIVEVPAATGGAACTALLAIDSINQEESVMVINGDQILEIDYLEMVQDFEKRGLDGGVPVFDDVHPRWSFVKCDQHGYVIEAAEKRPISREATAGVYWFKRGEDFLQGVMEMIEKGASHEGRYFVCPIFNQLILRQKKIGTYPLDKERYWSMAEPQGLDRYVEHYKALPIATNNEI